MSRYDSIHGAMPEAIWYLYNTTEGKIILKHPFRTRHKSQQQDQIPCPHCGTTLVWNDYKAECCQCSFRCGFGEAYQREPVGISDIRGGGYKTCRPWTGELTDWDGIDRRTP